jgi:hypothetical protein
MLNQFYSDPTVVAVDCHCDIREVSSSAATLHFVAMPGIPTATTAMLERVKLLLIFQQNCAKSGADGQIET